jgi:hypothetical protein
MRAGKYATADTVVCTDGQARAAGRSACESHGGVDSVSTLAAVKRRAAAYRFADRQDTTSSQGATVADVPKTKADSVKWGYQATEDPDVQNPKGYRGMERPVEMFPPDSAESHDSAAAAGATGRVNEMRRQDSLESSPDQNPPGYRGMERPAGVDSTADDTVARDTAAVQE